MPQWLTRHKWLLIGAAALVVLLAFAACGDEEEAGETPVAEKVQPTIPLKIGHLNSFTGDLADFGGALQNAAELAVTEINAAGGVGGQPVELAKADDATDPTQGVAEATRLIEVEGVDFILGALASGVTVPVAESVTGPKNVLHISGASTGPALTVAVDNDFLFRTTVSDAAQGPILAKVANELGLASVCTMYITGPYGQGLSEIFAEEFEALGGSVPAQVTHESEQATYASELDTCTAEGPDALAAIAYPASARVFLREAVERDVVENYLFVDGTKSSDLFEDLGWPEAFDDMRGTAPFAVDLPIGEAFETAYQATYGELPPYPFLRETYDAIYLMALATEKALQDDIDIRDALRDVANPEGEVVNPGGDNYTAALELIATGADINYEGAAGPVDLDENGDVPVGAIETWHVDVANKELVTDEVFQVDLTTGEITKIQ